MVVEELLNGRGFTKTVTRRWQQWTAFDRQVNDLVWRIVVERRTTGDIEIHAGVMIPVMYELMEEWLEPYSHSVGCPTITPFTTFEGKLAICSPKSRMRTKRVQPVDLLPVVIDHTIETFFAGFTSVEALLTTKWLRKTRHKCLFPVGYSWKTDWTAIRRACIQAYLGNYKEALAELDAVDEESLYVDTDGLRERITRLCWGIETP